MKKKFKLGNRLRLDKEVIARLDEEQMAMVAGGGDGEDCPSIVRCSCTHNSCTSRQSSIAEDTINNCKNCDIN
jgi:hypothetical protein